VKGLGITTAMAAARLYGSETGPEQGVGGEGVCSQPHGVHLRRATTREHHIPWPPSNAPL